MDNITGQKRMIDAGAKLVCDKIDIIQRDTNRKVDKKAG